MMQEKRYDKRTNTWTNLGSPSKNLCQCGNDPQKLVAYFMERQKQNPQRLLQKMGDIQKGQEKSVKENLPADAQKEIAV